jgi:hypothetical protein
MSDTSMSIHLEDEVIFPDWSPMSDTSMSIHLEDEVSFHVYSYWYQTLGTSQEK